MKIDESEVEIGEARFVQLGWGEPHLSSGIVVVSGPDVDGDIILLAAGESYLPSDTARRLAEEILRRLGGTE